MLLLLIVCGGVSISKCPQKFSEPDYIISFYTAFVYSQELCFYSISSVRYINLYIILFQSALALTFFCFRVWGCLAACEHAGVQGLWAQGPSKAVWVCAQMDCSGRKSIALEGPCDPTVVDTHLPGQIIVWFCVCFLNVFLFCLSFYFRFMCAVYALLVMPLSW